MYTKCSYKDCSVNKLYSSYFTIPTDYRREIWLKHSGNTSVNKSARFCEAHFYPADVIVKGTHKNLRRDALPMSCATICQCTATTTDNLCLRILNVKRADQRLIASNYMARVTAPKIPVPLLSKSTIKNDVINNSHNTIVGGGIQLKHTIIPHSSNYQQLPLPEKNNIANSLRPRTKKLINVSEQSVLDNSKRTPQPSKSRISIAEQMPNKEVQCLEAVVKYTSHMQSIVKQNGGLESFIQANTHLIKLLDKVVYEWFQRAQRRIEIGVITDKLFIEKAQESKQIFCIQNFDPDQEWLNRLKLKYNITDLDMRLLHIENNSYAPSVDIYEIVLHVLARNPIAEYFTITSPKDDTQTQNENNLEIKSENEIIPKTENDKETIVKTEDINRPDEDTDMEVQIGISNDEQARLHLKPLEEYVLLKDNFRAVGLISQLIEIFSSEIKKEET